MKRRESPPTATSESEPFRIHGARTESNAATPSVGTAERRHLRSPIPYAGSKSRVVKSLVKAIPTDWAEFREPFAGGLSLSLCLMQQYPTRRYWVNDLDPFLSGFWGTLASEPEKLAKTLNHYLLEFPSDEDKVHLGIWATQLIHDVTGVERAALYYIMSKLAFGGMPFVGYAVHPRRFNARAIQHLAKVGRLLSQVDLKVTVFDFADCVTDDPRVFTYFDPPYLISRFLYGENGNMHRSFDHRRFARIVGAAKSRWMVSYNDDLLIRSYFQGHRISTIQVHYSLAESRKQQELLITNYEN